MEEEDLVIVDILYPLHKLSHSETARYCCFAEKIGSLPPSAVSLSILFFVIIVVFVMPSDYLPIKHISILVLLSHHISACIIASFVPFVSALTLSNSNLNLN